MVSIPYGTRVLISEADAYHNGHVGVVTSHWQESASVVQVEGCIHVFHNSSLRPVPEPDTIPAPVDFP
jgi:hypothetical protein